MKGIMFTEEMLNAVREGGKTQTRRKIKDVPRSVETFTDEKGKITHKHWKEQPKYKLNEIVYIKEPYNVQYTDGRELVTYKYDLPEKEREGVKWTNKMYMPADMARFHIKIKEIRAEWMREISEKDAISEGVDRIKDVRTDNYFYKDYITGNYLLESPVKSFFTLWEKINGMGSSSNDCLVWVYRFTTINLNKEENTAARSAQKMK